MHAVCISVFAIASQRGSHSPPAFIASRIIHIYVLTSRENKEINSCKISTLLAAKNYSIKAFVMLLELSVESEALLLDEGMQFGDRQPLIAGADVGIAVTVDHDEDHFGDLDYPRCRCRAI